MSTWEIRHYAPPYIHTITSKFFALPFMAFPGT
jgi:hypothetical protein